MEEKKRKNSKSNKNIQKNKRRLNLKSLLANQKFKSIGKILSVFLVVLILLFIAADKFGNVTFSSIGDYFGGLASGAKSGAGYPYYFESNTPENVIKIGADLLAVEGEKAYVLDSTAKKIMENEYSYSKPIAQSSNSRAVIYDVGGTSYNVISRTKLLYENNLPSKIITASLGRDGSVAASVRGSGSMSRLLVYNKSQKVVYDWSCAKETIISTAISDNGQRIAVAVVGAQNGELYSKVMVFDIDYSEPVAEYEYGDKIVTEVKFIGGSRILVSGEKVLEFVKSDNDKKEIDLSLNTLSCIYTDSSNMTVAVFSKYGSSSVKILRAYSKSGKELFSTEINSNVKDVSCEGGYISVLTDRQLLNFNKRGKQVGSAEISGDGISCYTNGSNTYVLTTGAIDRYKTFGTEKKE